MSRNVRWTVMVLAVLPMTFAAWYFWSVEQDRQNLLFSRHNLSQIGRALQQYHDAYDRFPPAYIRGDNGKPWHSWRVLVLPYLGEEELFAKYRFDEPWDGPNNRMLQDLRPLVYSSNRVRSNRPDVTTYLGVMNRRTMWPAYFAVGMKDVDDGCGNTIHLVENITSDVSWLEPREMRERDLLALLPTAGQPKLNTRLGPRFCILLADGTPRIVSNSIPTKVLRSMLTPRHGQPMVSGDKWPPDLLVDDLIESGETPKLWDISHFPGTRVLPVPDGSLDLNQTSLYCAVQQITWDQLRPAPDSPVIVATPSPVIDSLNGHLFPAGSLAQECYFAGIVGLGRAASDDLFEQLYRRFPHAQVEMLPNRHGMSGIRLLVYLEKSLPFPEVMRRFTEPLQFLDGPHAQAVESFGWYCDRNQPISDLQADFPVLTETVNIRDYVSEEDFVISLNSVSRQGDEIILAKLTPQATLQATWETTAARLRIPLAIKVETQLQPEDQLQIPLLAIGVTAEITELIDLSVPTDDRPDRVIADCRQTIQFRLDERGAELICTEQMVVNDDEPAAENMKPRRFVFDRPFLLALKERNADTPYFLAWIANTDLMQRVK